MVPRLIAAFALAAALCTGLAACGGSGQAKNLGGTLFGLRAGNSVAVKNNNTGDTLTLTENGSFQFPTFVAANASYTVVVVNQPNGQNCTVANGTGMLDSGANPIDNIQVTCAP